MNYRELAEKFFDQSYQMKKIHHQQMLDESLRGEIFTLLYLKSSDQCVLPGAISRAMNISSARVATILNNLEQKQFIERQIDRLDRRRILVNLTPLGQEHASQHHQKVIDQLTRMLELLGEQDAKEFVRITAKIIDLAPEIVSS